MSSGGIIVKKHKERPPFIMLEKDLIWKGPRLEKENPSSPWWELSPAARTIYLILKAKYNGPDKGSKKTNNGKLTLYRNEIVGLKINGLKSPNTITAAFAELIKREWIKEEKRIGGEYKWTVLYRLTWKYDVLE
jgi:hypothetical protein